LSKSIINSLFDESISIVNKLEENKEISLASDAKRHFTKTFILASASYFEDKIQKILIDFVNKTTSNNEYVINFFKKKAISLQYHTYFDWGKKNNPNAPGKSANAFFGLFGENFKNKINTKINNDDKLKEAVECFIEIGHLRNILVHSNFASYNNIEKTIDELKNSYDKAELFVDFIESFLKNS